MRREKSVKNWTCKSSARLDRAQEVEWCTSMLKALIKTNRHGGSMSHEIHKATFQDLATLATLIARFGRTMKTFNPTHLLRWRCQSLLLALFCASVEVNAMDEGKQAILFSKIVDLSHVIDENIPLWPGDPAVQFDVVADFATDGYFLRRFSIGEHSATHMNAPNSFHQGGAGIDQYPPASLVVPAVVVDVRTNAANDSDYALSEYDVLQWESQHGRIAAGSVVILYTGWQEKWNDPVAFIGSDSNGGLHFPGFSAAATHFLLQERHIAGVGTDTHGVDPGADTSFVTNTEVLKKKRIVLECLTNLDKLPPVGTTLVLGILRLKGGSGTPLAVTAFVP